MADNKKSKRVKILSREEMSRMTPLELFKYSDELNQQTARLNRGTRYIMTGVLLVALISLGLAVARNYGWLTH